ncbi:MAG: hypothetical protein QM796_18895 [Chthoniobacteraceae bacterium]
MHLKNLLLSFIVVILVLAYLLFSLWQPERQVALHQEHLLQAYSDRKWSKVEGFLDDAYADRWGHKKEDILRLSRIAFAQFIAPEVTGLSPQLGWKAGTATITEKLAVAGEGNEFAQEAERRINRLPQPFVFTWQRKSWKPWDWTLVCVDNPGLEIGNLEDF